MNIEKKDYKILKSRFTHKKTLGILTYRLAEQAFDTIFKETIEKMLFEHFNVTPIKQRKYFTAIPKNAEEQIIAEIRPLVLVDIYSIIDDLQYKPQNISYRTKLCEYFEDIARWKERELHSIFGNAKYACKPLKLFNARTPAEFIRNHFEEVNNCTIECAIEKSIDRLVTTKRNLMQMEENLGRIK